MLPCSGHGQVKVPAACGQLRDVDLDSYHVLAPSQPPSGQSVVPPICGRPHVVGIRPWEDVCVRRVDAPTEGLNSVDVNHLQATRESKSAATCSEYSVQCSAERRHQQCAAMWVRGCDPLCSPLQLIACLSSMYSSVLYAGSKDPGAQRESDRNVRVSLLPHPVHGLRSGAQRSSGPVAHPTSFGSSTPFVGDSC